MRYEGTSDSMFLGRKLRSTLQAQEQFPRPVPGGNLIESEEKEWLRERLNFWTFKKGKLGIN